MKKLGLLVVAASLLLQGCGWKSKTRLIPLYERETPGILGTYDVASETVSFSRFTRDGLQNVTFSGPDGSRRTALTAYDLVQVTGEIQDGVDEREFTYLIESEQKIEGGVNFNYDLIAIRKQFDDSNRFTGDYSFKRYSLKCSDATARLNTNTEGDQCEFTRYTDLMAATDDVLRWMSDPRIAIEYSSGYKKSD
ncbi:hypothetical protein [Erythrobacter sp. YT30]|uniref:hypothetical protein n=1 Tax=Erythrobacter sp. YT30 TaxID=1735012 RepID=UPI00076CA5BE|nr:hypothetical protein [Erythrobacter sp. YT30]KWV91539.1 hypothetical protein AUC45_09915 [Erythrobacter sp. YT30]